MKKLERITLDYFLSKKVFSYIKDREWAVFLCSNHEVFNNQRYDIITCSPIQKIYAYREKTIVETNNIKKDYFEDPIEVLNKVMENYTSDISDLPFTGGAIGYISYDLGNKYEHIDIKNTEHKIFMKKYLRDRGIPISKFPKSGFGRQY